MTEALRPSPPAAIAGRVARPETAAAGRPIARPKAKAETRRPIHLAVVVGLSAGAYALSLAGVTALQASSEQSLADGYAPTADAVSLMRSKHDQLEVRLAAAAAAYDQAAASYDQVTGQLKGYEAGLGALAKQVTKVKGSAAYVPMKGSSLPSVGRATSSAAKPVAHATTCASGKVCP